MTSKETMPYAYTSLETYLKQKACFSRI